MQEKIPLKIVIGPLLFSLAVYLSWTLGRLFFCGIAI